MRKSLAGPVLCGIQVQMIELRDLTKHFGPAQIIRGISLKIEANEIHGVIGPNGAGKSTLFNLISGAYKPSGGDILLEGASISRLSPQEILERGLSRSFQITNIFPKLTVFENVQIALIGRSMSPYNFWSLLSRKAKLTDACEALLLEARLQNRRGDAAGTLNYSEQRALEIIITLASNPKALLLDEPMAGMSTVETRQAAAFIRKVSKGRTCLIIEHDMDIVFDLCDRVSVLVYGQIIATGSPVEIKNNPEVQRAYLGTGLKL